MTNVLLVATFADAVILIVLILIQAKGTGLSAVFGGEGEMYRSRRGVEKLVHRGTIAVAALFMILSVVNILVNK